MHSPIQLLINNDPKQRFYPDECWKKVSVHGESLDGESQKSTFSTFPRCMHTVLLGKKHTLNAVRGVHANVGVTSGLW